MSGDSLPPRHVVWTGQTDRGRVRKNNEDAFLGLLVNAQGVQHLGKTGTAATDSADLVFAVSDGMGGAMAGEFASKTAVEKTTRLLPPLFRQRAAGLSPGFGEVLQEIFAEIHKALLYLGSCYEECAGMGATLSLVWITPGHLHFAHVGDSRIYYLPAGGTMRQISHDDTYVGWMYRNGQINEREAKTHPRRNVLQKALGAGHQFIDPQIGDVVLQPGDRFLLCSDGVTDGLYDERLAEILQSGQENPAAEVVRRGVESSGRDNATAVVLEIKS